MTGFRLLRIAVFTLLAAGCQTAEIRNDRLARFVDEIAFGGPFDEHLAQDRALARWSGVIRATVSGVQADEYRIRVVNLLAAFTRLTGISAALADENETTNFTVTFFEKPDFLINREHVPCYASLRGDNHRITGTEVQISVAELELVDSCLAHEFMHAFGLRYHSGIINSVLSPAHEATGLTPWDELALTVLFDARLEPGTTRDDASPTIRDIISEISANRLSSR